MVPWRWIDERAFEDSRGAQLGGFDGGHVDVQVHARHVLIGVVEGRTSDSFAKG